MAVVVDQLHRRAVRRAQLGEQVEAAADAGERFQRARDRLRRHAELPGDGRGGQRVLHVVAARQRQRHRRAVVFRQAQGEAACGRRICCTSSARTSACRIEAVGHQVARRLRRQRRDFGIVDAQHRQSVERQAVQELGERRLHAGEVAAVVLQMIRIDIGDDRDQRIQAQEAAVALVRLGHQPVAAAQARIGAGGEQLPADDEGRIDAALGQHACQQRGRGGLAVRAGDGDAAAEAHQFGQHLGARHDRDALRARLHQFGIVALDRARHHDAVGTEHVGRGVAAMHGGAELREPARDGVVGGVRARHLVAERAQHFGNAAHADAADADEMHARITPWRGRPSPNRRRRSRADP